RPATIRALASAACRSSAKSKPPRARLAQSLAQSPEMAAPSVRWLWLTLAILAADRVSKFAIERLTAEGFRRPLVPNFADLVHNVNAGIAFGLFSESASKWISFLLVLSSAAVILLIGWLLFAGHAGRVESQAG